MPPPEPARASRGITADNGTRLDDDLTAAFVIVESATALVGCRAGRGIVHDHGSGNHGGTHVVPHAAAFRAGRVAAYGTAEEAQVAGATDVDAATVTGGGEYFVVADGRPTDGKEGTRAGSVFDTSARAVCRVATYGSTYHLQVCRPWR